MKVLDFIKTKGKHHCEMQWLDNRKGFDMEIYRSRSSGIYFILDGDNIMKVGKADGKGGLHSRLYSYRNDHTKRIKVCRTVQLYDRVMNGELRGKTLSVYVFEMESPEVLFEGYTVKSSIVRSFEETLSKQARAEGHSMLLSGQD